jgi:CRISPR type III-B/RAMP module RAMP protein Cmr1
MKRSDYTLELLTPCFCAGADQSRAEIRASSIRGQLRWWFRVLGGGPDDERTVFGGVAGSATSSSVIVRVTDLKRGPEWRPPAVSPNAVESYVWYFASVSGKAPGSGRSSVGPRWTPSGAVPPKTTFTLQLIQHRPLPPALQSRLNLALRCFLQLGSIGLRATRGPGAFVCHEHPFSPDILDTLRQHGFGVELRPRFLESTNEIAREIGGLLKGTRRALGMNAKHPSPFGTSSPRQTSAIYFRPVCSQPASRQCQLLVFEAPHDKVLGAKTVRQRRVVGQTPSLLQFPSAGGHPR